ncbi:hypothetical protein XENTR_v10016120 [Xenopus tropicalis]|nr:hypothetical protein XENTR_v10016120 [Xenopus tropicalis]
MNCDIYPTCSKIWYAYALEFYTSEERNVSMDKSCGSGGDKQVSEPYFHVLCSCNNCSKKVRASCMQ